MYLDEKYIHRVIIIQYVAEIFRVEGEKKRNKFGSSKWWGCEKRPFGNMKEPMGKGGIRRAGVFIASQATLEEIGVRVGRSGYNNARATTHALSLNLAWKEV